MLVFFSVALSVFILIAPPAAMAQPDGLSALLYARMKYLGFQQQILSRNISNADTPGYRSQRPESFIPALTRGTSGSAGIATTHPEHIGSSASLPFKATRNPYPSMRKPNGNDVDIQQEITDMNLTELQYRQATQLTTKLKQLRMTALGEGR